MVMGHTKMDLTEWDIDCVTCRNLSLLDFISAGNAISTFKTSMITSSTHENEENGYSHLQKRRVHWCISSRHSYSLSEHIT